MTKGCKAMIDLEGFKNYLYEEELSPNTIYNYMIALTKFSEKYSEITKPNLIEYKKYLIDNCKPKTVNNRITAILNYCKYKEIPMKLKQIKEPKKTHIDNVISGEQFKKLTDGLKKDNDIRSYSQILILAKTGMRISEALKMKKSDLLNGSATIHTKAHMRTIYFPKSLIDDIKPYLDTLDDDNFVMLNKYGEKITSRGVAENLQRFAIKYDIPKEVMHPHSFRHFFAIEFLKRNNNIALLADVLGHSSVDMTQLYLRQSEIQQKEAVDMTVNW